MKQFHYLIMRKLDTEKQKAAQYSLSRNPFLGTNISRLILFFLIFIVGCGVSYDKDDYIREFKQFVDEVKIGYKSYTVADWQIADEKYEQYSVQEYEIFSDDLTGEDMKIIGQLKGTYTTLKIRVRTNDLLEQSKDIIDQAEGVIDDVLESIKK